MLSGPEPNLRYLVTCCVEEWLDDDEAPGSALVDKIVALFDPHPVQTFAFFYRLVPVRGPEGGERD